MIMTLVLAAATTAWQPPDYPMGLLLPPRDVYRKAISEGVNFDRYAKGRKALLPAAVDLTPMLPPPYPPGQQDEDCVGWAMAFAAKTYFEAREQNRKPTSLDSLFSPMYIYSQRPNRDAPDASDRRGMYPTDAIKILKARGCATWSMMPYEKDRVNDPPNDEVVLSSFPYQIANHMVVPGTPEAIKVMLANNQVVVLGIAVCPAFKKIRGIEVFKDHDPEEIKGYHAICAVGYDDSKRAIRLQNSWGNDWADKGYCWVSYDLFNQDEADSKKFCAQAYTLIEAPTVRFVPEVRNAEGGQGQSWRLSLEGSPQAMQDIVSVTYSLPDPIKPGLITKNDQDARFAIDSSELSIHSFSTPVPLESLISTRGGFQVYRVSVIPCGQSSEAFRPPAGSPRVVVPNVESSTPSEAAFRLSRIGLKVRVARFSKSLGAKDIAAGKVVRQYPEPSSKVAKDSTIILFVNE